MMQHDREHSRYPIYATATITPKSPNPQAPLFTIVNNISRTGIGIYAYAPLQENTPVAVELAFFSDRKGHNKDTIEGNVAWMSREGDLFFVGIYFDEEINQDKHPNLYNHFSQIQKRD